MVDAPRLLAATYAATCDGRIDASGIRPNVSTRRRSTNTYARIVPALHRLRCGPSANQRAAYSANVIGAGRR